VASRTRQICLAAGYSEGFASIVHRSLSGIARVHSSRRFKKLFGHSFIVFLNSLITAGFACGVIVFVGTNSGCLCFLFANCFRVFSRSQGISCSLRIYRSTCFKPTLHLFSFAVLQAFGLGCFETLFAREPVKS